MAKRNFNGALRGAAKAQNLIKVCSDTTDHGLWIKPELLEGYALSVGKNGCTQGNI